MAVMNCQQAFTAIRAGAGWRCWRAENRGPHTITRSRRQEMIPGRTPSVSLNGLRHLRKLPAAGAADGRTSRPCTGVDDLTCAGAMGKYRDRRANDGRAHCGDRMWPRPRNRRPVCRSVFAAGKWDGVWMEAIRCLIVPTDACVNASVPSQQRWTKQMELVGTAPPPDADEGDSQRLPRLCGLWRAVMSGPAAPERCPKTRLLETV